MVIIPQGSVTVYHRSCKGFKNASKSEFSESNSYNTTLLISSLEKEQNLKLLQRQEQSLTLESNKLEVFCERSLADFGYSCVPFLYGK